LAWGQDKGESAQVLEAANLQGPARAARLLDGAKKEGELMLYHVMPAIDMAPVIEAFTKKYGIPVKTWRSSSETVLQRVITESHGARFVVDLVENNSPELEAMHRERLLQAVNSPSHQDIIPEALPEHREWVGNTIDVFVQAYNTNLIKKEDLPKSYSDLLDPKWKGRLGLEAADQNWFAMLSQELGQEKVEKLFRSIVELNGISVRSGHSQLANMVAAGEVPLALTVLNYTPPQLKLKGAPIDSFILSPGIAYFRGIALLKKSPHPFAALLFYDFLQSEEGQQILVNRSKFSVNKKLTNLKEKIPLKYIDPAKALDNAERWTRSYEEIVTKRAKS
jgi:iron(III) transport system substrate-binding protein